MSERERDTHRESERECGGMVDEGVMAGGRQKEKQRERERERERESRGDQESFQETRLV